MKTVKSRALTAFVALALMASHGVHGIQTFPMKKALRGVRASRAQDTSFKSKMRKGHAKAAAVCKAWARKALNAVRTKLVPYTKRHPKKLLLLGAIGVLVLANVIRGKQKRREKTKALISDIKSLFKENDLKEQFERFFGPLEALKNAIEKGEILSKDALNHLSDPINSLGRIAKAYGKKSSYDIFNILRNCTLYLEWALKEGAPQTEAKDLTGAFTELMREKLSEEMQGMGVAPEQSDHLAALMGPFRDFKSRVNEKINDLSSEDIYELSSAVRWLRSTQKEKGFNNVIRSLESAISSLKRMNVPDLGRETGDLITALTDLMKKNLLEEMQEMRGTLGEKHHLEDLVKAFEAFENRVNEMNNLDSKEIWELSNAMGSLRSAEEEDTSERMMERLKETICRLECVTEKPEDVFCRQGYMYMDTPLGHVLRMLITALTDLMKKNLLEEMQEIRGALGENRHLEGLVNAFEVFEGRVNEINDLDSRGIYKLSHVMERLREVTEANCSEDVIKKLGRAIYWLEDVMIEGLKESKIAFNEAITKAIDQVRAGRAGEVEAKEAEE